MVSTTISELCSINVEKLSMLDRDAPPHCTDKFEIQYLSFSNIGISTLVVQPISLSKLVTEPDDHAGIWDLSL